MVATRQSKEGDDEVFEVREELDLIHEELAGLKKLQSDVEDLKGLHSEVSEIKSMVMLLCNKQGELASAGKPVEIAQPGSNRVTEDNKLKGSDLQENLDQSDQMFKPGWKDIFRMNQSELEDEIRKVSRDCTLDPRRKAYLIQNLMTSRWIPAQQKSPQPRPENHNGCTVIPGCVPSYRDPEKQIFGCEHYKRYCKLVAACCNKLFTCRFCHDKVSDHTIERKATVEMMCMLCLKVQPVGPNCQTPSCNGLSMAKYYCSICKFFDDERSVYHCPFCNLCRLGKGLGSDFFHCMKCNCCLGMTLLEHKCREKKLETNCPICCDFLFTSSAAVRCLPCGHFMHSACFQAYTCSHYTCPICCKSLGDMTVYFGMLDGLLSAEELPEEYRDRCQKHAIHSTLESMGWFERGSGDSALAPSMLVFYEQLFLHSGHIAHGWCCHRCNCERKLQKVWASWFMCL